MLSGMSNLVGGKVYVSNRHLVFFLISLLGIFSFSSLLYWKAQSLLAAEFVPIPEDAQFFQHIHRSEKHNLDK